MDADASGHFDLRSRAAVLPFARADACWEATGRTGRGRQGGCEGVPRLSTRWRAEEKGATALMSDSNEVLVVASKIKTYIKTKGDMKTSGNVLNALSDRLRSLCDQAIENARSDGRKTVLDRDIP
jgi:histone H3/H4